MLKKLTMLKVPVVPLNNPVDYGAWHIAFRRLVKGYNMGDALMFTIPEDRVKAFKTRAEITKIKLEEEVPSARPYIQAPIIQPQAPFQPHPVPRTIFVNMRTGKSDTENHFTAKKYGDGWSPPLSVALLFPLSFLPFLLSSFCSLISSSSSNSLCQ